MYNKTTESQLYAYLIDTNDVNNIATYFRMTSLLVIVLCCLLQSTSEHVDVAVVVCKDRIRPTKFDASPPHTFHKVLSSEEVNACVCSSHTYLACDDSLIATNWVHCSRTRSVESDDRSTSFLICGK